MVGMWTLVFSWMSVRLINNIGFLLVNGRTSRLVRKEETEV